jgi:diaminobutyrate-2-oxoglutarate transaminase
VVAFTHGFHGVSMGSLAATANSHFRDAAGISPVGVTFMPYDGYLGENFDTLDYFEKTLTDGSSGLDKPAAVLVETVQGEGGINVASTAWLQRLERLCRAHDLLLIVDDIQMGCGRTGRFFSFEEAGIQPDLVTLSKSLSGYGLPLSVLLIRPELDQWKPGEHNGTFRGHNLAFVTATAALERFWCDDDFAAEIRRKGEHLATGLDAMIDGVSGVSRRGRGLVQGLDTGDGETASAITQECFRRGLMMETSGADDEVVKFLPPLTVSDAQIDQALEIVEQALNTVLDDEKGKSRKAGGMA